MLRSFPHTPPFPGLKRFSQRPGNIRVVFFARDFFIGRASQTDDVVGRDAALLCVKSRQLSGFECGFVVNDNGRFSERLLGAAHYPERKQ